MSARNAVPAAVDKVLPWAHAPLVPLLAAGEAAGAGVPTGRRRSRVRRP
ncbi:hypothetical protein [Streptomyces graminofaciens]|nr:hypothetical protein [Streptomyces graminofaciens]